MTLMSGDCFATLAMTVPINQSFLKKVLLGVLGVLGVLGGQ
jgi:hypothetical protein